MTAKLLLCAVLGWAVASLLKIPAAYLATHRWELAAALRPGMPSAISALAAAAGLNAGLEQGWGSALYWILFVAAVLLTTLAVILRWRKPGGSFPAALGEVITGIALGMLVTMMIWVIEGPLNG